MQADAGAHKHGARKRGGNQYIRAGGMIRCWDWAFAPPSAQGAAKIAGEPRLAGVAGVRHSEWAEPIYPFWDLFAQIQFGRAAVIAL